METRERDSGTAAVAEVRTEREDEPASGNSADSANGSNGAKTLGGVLSRAALLQHAKTARPLFRVELPWVGADAHVFVRGLSANQRDKFEDRVYSVGADKKVVAKVEGVRALMLLLCTCDADGKPIFHEADLPALEGIDAHTADAIYAVASRESGLTQRDVDELVGNLTRGPSGER